MADRPLCPANDGTRTSFKPAMRGDDTVVKATAVAPTNRDIENQVIYGATYKVHATNLDPKKKHTTCCFPSGSKHLVISHLLVPHHPMLLLEPHTATTTTNIPLRLKRRATPNRSRPHRRWWICIPRHPGRMFGVMTVSGIDLGKVDRMLRLDVAIGVCCRWILGLGIRLGRETGESLFPASEREGT